MKNYELLCVIKTNLDIDSMEQNIQNIDSAIKNLNGQVLNIEKLGRRKLAYEVGGFTDGFYVIFDMQVSPEKITELRRYLKLNENVIRELITVKAEKKVTANK